MGGVRVEGGEGTAEGRPAEADALFWLLSVIILGSPVAADVSGPLLGVSLDEEERLGIDNVQCSS